MNLIYYMTEKNIKIRLALASALIATSVSTRIILVSLPNIKLVSFITILSGIIGGPFLGSLVGLFSMLLTDIFYFGVGLWIVATSLSMSLIGILSGFIWYKSSNIPSKLQLGIFGCLLTLLYDILTSILSLPVLFNLLYGNFDKFWFLIFNLLIGLFLPLGGFLWPAGPAHELFTALLLVFIGPTLIRRIKLILNDKYN